MKYLVAFFFIVFNPILYGQDISNDAFDTAVDEFERHLISNGSIVKTAKPISMYHWNTGAKWARIITDEEVVTYLERESQRFWSPDPLPHNGEGLLLAEGIYAAKDPFMSDYYGYDRTYMGSAQLIEINFPQNTSYLDTRNDNQNGDSSKGNRISLNPQIIDVLSKAGCQVKDRSHWRWGILNVPACKKILFKVLKKNNVKFVRHSWYEGQTFKSCEREASAFLVISVDYQINDKDGNKVNPAFLPHSYTDTNFNSQILKTSQNNESFLIAASKWRDFYEEGEEGSSDGSIISQWVEDRKDLQDILYSEQGFLDWKKKLIHCN